ncbi:MAG: hypothetical protein V1492_00610 [Candidatus Micrarchaeota archaeon]
MRGYFTFLIVFAAFLLLVSLAQFNSNAKQSNAGSAIWVERYYQAQMNGKEAIAEAAREGAKSGAASFFTEYVAECVVAKVAARQPPEQPNFICLKKSVNTAAVDRIKQLDNAYFEGLHATLQLGEYDYGKCLTPCDKTVTSAANLLVDCNPDAGKLPKDAKYYEAADVLQYANSVAAITLHGNKITLVLDKRPWQDMPLQLGELQVSLE